MTDQAEPLDDFPIDETYVFCGKLALHEHADGILAITLPNLIAWLLAAVTQAADAGHQDSARTIGSLSEGLMVRQKRALVDRHHPLSEGDVDLIDSGLMKQQVSGDPGTAADDYIGPKKVALQ